MFRTKTRSHSQQQFEATDVLDVTLVSFPSLT